MEDVFGFDEPTVEFVILADHVEAVHGKLYMMGGGWENISVHDFEAPITLQIAASVQVPWNATNRQHLIRVEIQTVDGFDGQSSGLQDKSLVLHRLGADRTRCRPS